MSMGAEMSRGDGPEVVGTIHPSVVGLLRFFEYEHLPLRLQEISRPFSVLAQQMAETLSGPELTVGLRKMVEAKDCMVRAAL